MAEMGELVELGGLVGLSDLVGMGDLAFWLFGGFCGWVIWFVGSILLF